MNARTKSYSASPESVPQVVAEVRSSAAVAGGLDKTKLKQAPHPVASDPRCASIAQSRGFFKLGLGSPDVTIRKEEMMNTLVCWPGNLLRAVGVVIFASAVLFALAMSAPLVVSAVGLAANPGPALLASTVTWSAGR